MASLITKLIDKHPGTVLVIGGGPSVTDDLASLPSSFKPSCVISANAHGFKQKRFKPDYIVCVDDMHSETKKPMRELLSPYCVPIITRQWWGDYRIPNRPTYLRLNSGLSAVAIGALMGGNPVLVTGLDCYTGDTYFHDKSVLTCQSSVAWPRFSRQILRLEKLIASANIRPMSGPLTEDFPAYDRDEVFEPPFVTQMRKIKQYEARSITAFRWNLADLPAGARFPVSEKEARHMIHNSGRYPLQVAGLDS